MPVIFSIISHCCICYPLFVRNSLKQQNYPPPKKKKQKKKTKTKTKTKCIVKVLIGVFIRYFRRV